MKRASNMDNMPQVSQKMHFDPLTLKITKKIIILVPQYFFQFNFSIKNYFCYFLVPG